VLACSLFKVIDKVTLPCVALVESLRFNLLSSQLFDEGFELLFQPGGSWIMDSRVDLVCMVEPKVQVF
jgi:hypothetical protein